MNIVHRGFENQQSCAWIFKLVGDVGGKVSLEVAAEQRPLIHCEALDTVQSHQQTQQNIRKVRASFLAPCRWEVVRRRQERRHGLRVNLQERSMVTDILQQAAFSGVRSLAHVCA